MKKKQLRDQNVKIRPKMRLHSPFLYFQLLACGVWSILHEFMFSRPWHILEHTQTVHGVLDLLLKFIFDIVPGGLLVTV